jgi:hypothetical protein
MMIGIVQGAFAPLLEDNVSYHKELPGRSDVNPQFWSDSYSDGDSCYCKSTFDHDIGSVLVDTPLGVMTVKEVCDLLGDGPRGSEGRPLYNDIQCGNGPANNAGDEDDCPGRTEYGQDGCKYTGPKWNFSRFLPSPRPTNSSIAGNGQINGTITGTKVPVSTKAPSKAPIATKAPTNAPIVVKVPRATPVTKAPTPSPLKRPSSTLVSSCEIVQLDLWNALIDKRTTSNITSGGKICNSFEVAIEAITTTCVKSVRFELTGPQNFSHTKNEYNAPYFLYGNSGSSIFGKNLSLGMYKLTVSPDKRADLTKSISFEVISC